MLDHQGIASFDAFREYLYFVRAFCSTYSVLYKVRAAHSSHSLTRGQVGLLPRSTVQESYIGGMPSFVAGVEFDLYFTMS